MSVEQLTVGRPDPRRHREAIFDLTGKAFHYHGYWNWLAYCRECYFDHGPYDWSASTIGLLGDRVVTHWGVWGYPMRIGRATVRVAGIGAVSTDGDFRKRGLMARTARAGVEAAARAGYDLTILFGLANFYHRFGYVRAWPGQTYFADVGELPAGPPQPRVRKFALRHREDLARLYNAAHASLTGTAVRPTYLRMRQPWSGYLWTAPAGKPTGYVVVRTDSSPLEVIDHAGESQAVLRVLRRLAERGGAKEVQFSALHYNSDLARLLRRGTCRLERRYRRSGGAMVHTLGLASTLGKLAGELSGRLRLSHLSDWRGRLVIADAAETVALEIDRSGVRLAADGKAGRARHAVRGGQEIAQLLIGTDEPGEVVEAGRMRLTGDAARLVEVLFAPQHPMLSLWDGF